MPITAINKAVGMLECVASNPQITLPIAVPQNTHYEHPRGVIASVLTTLISSPGVEIDNAAIHLDALDRYRKTKVHFVDCLIAATASAQDVPVATFDHDFRKFADVRVEVE